MKVWTRKYSFFWLKMKNWTFISIFSTYLINCNPNHTQNGRGLGQEWVALTATHFFKAFNDYVLIKSRYIY